MKRKGHFPVASQFDYKKLKTETKQADITTSNFNYSNLNRSSTSQQQQVAKTPQSISYASLRQQSSQNPQQKIQAKISEMPTSLISSSVTQQQSLQQKIAKERPPSQSQYSTRPPQSVQSARSRSGMDSSLNPLKTDVNSVLHKMDLKGHLKDVLDPDIERLKRYAKRKELIKRHQEKLIKAGKIKAPEQKKVNQSLKIDENDKINLNMTDTGELRDDKGNLIKIDNNRHSTKVNKKKKQQDKIKQMIKLAQQNNIKHSFLFDQNVSISATNNRREKQKSHAFHFIEQRGQTQGDLQQEKNKSIDLEGFLTQIQKPDSGAKGSLKESGGSMQTRVSLRVKHHDPIPNVEWWDLPFFEDVDNASYLPRNLDQAFVIPKTQFQTPSEHENNLQSIKDYEYTKEFYKPNILNNLVEHPFPFKSQYHHSSQAQIPFFLTKKERKKIKRKRKMDKQKDLTDKIKLGLIDPPPPKVKLSNMLNVYQNDAIADPSKIEQEVRQQIQARLQKHLQNNMERKLTSEQKYEKKMKKLKKDSSTECRVALFRIENLQHGQHKFKIDKNAQSLQMHGICLVPAYEEGYSCPVLLLVEGGPKAIKRYTKLIMKRIKWNQGANEDREEQKNLDLSGNKASLVWEGVIKEHNFKQWKVLEIKNEMEGKRALNERGVEQYWDKVMQYKESE